MTITKGMGMNSWTFEPDYLPSKLPGVKGSKIEGITIKDLLYNLLMGMGNERNRDDIAAVKQILDKYKDVAIEPTVFWKNDYGMEYLSVEPVSLGMPCIQESGKPWAIFLNLKPKFNHITYIKMQTNISQENMDKYVREDPKWEWNETMQFWQHPEKNYFLRVKKD